VTQPAAPVGSAADRAARATVCPVTGRVGLWTETRETRPRPAVQRQPMSADRDGCPFCDPAPDDDRLLPLAADRGAGRWFGLRNIYPPLTGPTGRADLAVATAHSPTLAHPQPDLATVWATMLDVQLQLAARAPARWSLVTTAVGVSAGASQHHPHGQVLTPAAPPPMTIEQQRHWADRDTATSVLAEPLVVATLADVHLVAPLVPLGPLDLWLVPARPAGLAALDPAVVGALVARWLGAVHQQLGPTGARDAAAPVDLKTLLHPPLPDGTGRWWAELQVTERHAPEVAAAPLVDVLDPPEQHAQRFRSADRSA
jgi:hypothetical protein